jgi:hypothetical protein
MKWFYTLVEYKPRPLIGFYERIPLSFCSEYRNEAVKEKEKIEKVLQSIDPRYTVYIERVQLGIDDWDYVI